MSKTQRRLLIISIMLILSALLAEGYVRQEKFDRMGNEGWYADLVTQVLQSEWECLPEKPEAREEFVLGLIKRFSPSDYEQLERGRAWIEEYKIKNITGNLTVGEREEATTAFEAYSSDGTGTDEYYKHPWSDLLTKASSKTIWMNTCILSLSEECPSSIIFQNRNDFYFAISIRYEKGGLAWNIEGHQWRELVEREYKNLPDKDKITKELEEVVSKNSSLLYEAKMRVSEMKASEVTVSDEKEIVHHEYIKQKCKTQKIPI